MPYGAEAWKHEQAVLILGRKIFRRIYGPKYENGEWKSGTNRELEEVSKGENIVKWIKGQRISWLGHLERMEEDRMHKKGREGEEEVEEEKKKKNLKYSKMDESAKGKLVRSPRENGGG